MNFPVHITDLQAGRLKVLPFEFSLYIEISSLALSFIHKLPSQGELGLWQIEESDSYFESRLDLSASESQQLAPLKNRRRTEWLASRWLLHVMSGRTQRGAVIKDACGKPRLLDSDWEISISHTQSHVAVVAAPFLVGIDIQVRVEKISRIAPKFMSDAESKNVAPHRAIEFLHLYWGAKESLYKAYGRRSLDFKKHIRIDAFNLEDGCTTGQVIKDEIKLAFDIYFTITQEYFLVYALERN